MAAPPDSHHFEAWMGLIGAGIALIASLATAALSGRLEARRDATRRAHEAEVRFHDVRMTTYVEFVSVLTTIGGAARVWLMNGAHGRFMNTFQFDADKYVNSLGRARMLAREPLGERIREVENLVHTLLTRSPSPEATEAAENLSSAVISFEEAAREEMGITSGPTA